MVEDGSLPAATGWPVGWPGELGDAGAVVLAGGAVAAAASPSFFFAGGLVSSTLASDAGLSFSE